MEGEQPYLGDLLAMLLNHLLTGMILQVGLHNFFEQPTNDSKCLNGITCHLINHWTVEYFLGKPISNLFNQKKQTKSTKPPGHQQKPINFFWGTQKIPLQLQPSGQTRKNIQNLNLLGILSDKSLRKSPPFGGNSPTIGTMAPQRFMANTGARRALKPGMRFGIRGSCGGNDRFPTMMAVLTHFGGVFCTRWFKPWPFWDG